VGSQIAQDIDFKAVALRNIDKLPPFSPILSHLLATLAQENVSFANLAETIEKDSVLSGQVLRMVNSALYARSGTVNSVRHAVSLLGIAKLRNLTLTFGVTSLWSRVKAPVGWSLKRFNLHAAATALMADLLATRVPVPYAEGAFAAGLFHDIGKLLIAVALPLEAERVARAGWTVDTERAFLGMDHAELSAEILSRWKLPAQIQQAVAAHHSPPQGAASALANLAAAADQFSNLNGYSVDARPESDPGQSLRGLGFDGEVADLRPEFDSAFDSIRQFF
jgi:putative nucleotidyltransferase with HDIG domain